MASIRAMAGRDGEAGEWLKVIWEANDIRPGTFLSPEHTGPWWAGGEVEEYPDARVIHRGDGTVSIVSKTDEGDRVLRAAAVNLGIHMN